jgi:hypothetical protein
MYRGLCVMAHCPHFDGGESAAAPTPAGLKASYRGATAAVRSALLESPQRNNGDVARLCQCSMALVSLVRRQLGLQRKSV